MKITIQAALTGVDIIEMFTKELKAKNIPTDGKFGIVIFSEAQKKDVEVDPSRITIHYSK